MSMNEIELDRSGDARRAKQEEKSREKNTEKSSRPRPGEPVEGEARETSRSIPSVVRERVFDRAGYQCPSTGLTGRGALSGRGSRSITRNPLLSFELMTSDTFVFCADDTISSAPSRPTVPNAFEGKSMRDSARESRQIPQPEGPRLLRTANTSVRLR